MIAAKITTLCLFTLVSIVLFYEKLNLDQFNQPIYFKYARNSLKTMNYSRTNGSLIVTLNDIISGGINKEEVLNIQKSTETKNYFKCIIKASLIYKRMKLEESFQNYLKQECFKETLSKENICKWKENKLVGALFVNRSKPTIGELRRELYHVKPGGKWSPSHCKANFKTAIIIPFRDRLSHLILFLRHIHPILLRQNQNYQIFVIEQKDDHPFNRGKLMNVGYRESLKVDSFDCFIFHDVDLLPEDDGNDYSCHFSPSHLSVAVDKFRYRLPYISSFGGVEAFKKRHFQRINGFSNEYWGWGAEDDDLFMRTQRRYLRVHRPNLILGRYQTLHHEEAKKGKSVDASYHKADDRIETEGLNTLSYKVIDKSIHEFYTMLSVDLLRETNVTKSN